MADSGSDFGMVMTELVYVRVVYVVCGSNIGIGANLSTSMLLSRMLLHVSP